MLKSSGPHYRRQCAQVRGLRLGTSAGTEQQRAGKTHVSHEEIQNLFLASVSSFFNISTHDESHPT